MAEKTEHSSYCDGNVGEAIQMQSKAVFVGYNLPNWITKDLLIQHFHSFRDELDLDSSTIIDIRGNRHGKVFFTDGRAVDQAIKQLNGTLLQGKFRLKVKPWVSKSAEKSRLRSEEGGKEKKSACEATQMQSKAVFVGYNLPDWITEELLIQHFHSFRDKLDLGRSTIIDTQGNRHGKVFFTDSCAVNQAIEQLNGTLLQGEFRLNVKPWVSKAAKNSQLQSKGGGKRKNHIKSPQQSDMPFHRQPQVGTSPRPPFPSNARHFGIPYPDQQCVPQMGPQYRRLRPPFRPGPGERMPFPPIRPLSSGSHPYFTGPHPPPVPYTYPGHLPSTISSKSNVKS